MNEGENKLFFLNILALVSLFFTLSVSDVDARSDKLYVICDEWPPYQLIEDNHVSGFSTKIVEIVFERIGVKLEHIEVYPWKRAIHMIEHGEADALFSANFTKNRSEFAHYPEETLVNSPWVMWVKKDSKLDFKSFDDLYGKRVGVVMGYSYTTEFWKYLKRLKNYEEVHNDEINLKKLNAGRIDFVPAELGNSLYIANRSKLNKIIPLITRPIKTDGLYIIFNKSNVKKSLVDQFSNELKKLKQEPIYKKLYEKHFSFKAVKQF